MKGRKLGTTHSGIVLPVSKKNSHFRLSSIPCPTCGSELRKIIDTRNSTAGPYIRRRIACPNGHRYGTVEKVILE